MSEEISLMALFRDEAQSHSATLAQGLLELEGDAANPQRIEPLMRAAHSIKGAARIVQVAPAVRLAHAMEDVFVAAQDGKVRIKTEDIDVLLRGADLLATLANITEETKDAWGVTHEAALKELEAALLGIKEGGPPVGQASLPATPLPRPLPTAAGPEVPMASAGKDACPAGTASPPFLPAGDDAMWGVFREELRQAARAIDEGLGGGVEVTMVEAAHSIRGAARIVQLAPPAELATAIEQALFAAHQGRTRLSEVEQELVRAGLAALVELLPLGREEAGPWAQQRGPALAEIQQRLDEARRAVTVIEQPSARLPVGPAAPPQPARVQMVAEAPRPEPPREEAVVRVTAQSLDRLMGLAGESLVQARWLQPFATALLKLKKKQDHLAALLDAMAQTRGLEHIEEARRQMATCRATLAERMREFEDHAAQAEGLNTRLYREVIVSRMRPFSDGAHGFPRLVRDMARDLGKQARLEIDGLTTEVDRDILERLEAPLNHLLRNAIDHGIEPPHDRRAAGKPEMGTVRLEVRHRAGMLAITVGDDGGGIELEKLRRKIVERGLTRPELARQMGEAELLEFLFLPGFSTAQEVTEYSGRGVGLDVVQTTIRRIGGSARISTKAGQGTAFHLQLPLTLSVVRAVLVDIAGEPYAFPHNRIDRLLRLPRSAIRSVEHRQFITVDGQNVGLVQAAQLLDLPPVSDPIELPVVLLSDESGTYGLIVESFRGEQDLVVRPLDPRLGKVPNVQAAAILDDGEPVLIADVEDMIRSMDQFIQAGTLARMEGTQPREQPKRRVLVVDDSITVREAERQILRNAGYDVAVAVDGADGWNQVRGGKFDLVVTDIDMPRMTGLELVEKIRGGAGLERLPVIVVSYKDRAEDRRRGLEAGANRYLTKSSFHDDSFLQAVADLIGGA
jgi:two-component system sensor histidine kinase and response regulator WspE